jgi:hypothetical protein
MLFARKTLISVASEFKKNETPEKQRQTAEGCFELFNSLGSDVKNNLVTLFIIKVAKCNDINQSCDCKNENHTYFMLA